MASPTSVLASRDAIKNMMHKSHDITSATPLAVKNSGINVPFFLPIECMKKAPPASCKRDETVSSSSFLMAPSTTTVTQATAEAATSMEGVQEVKDALLQDLRVLLDEFTKFQQKAAQSPEAEDPASKARAAKVDFFLGYITRVMHEVEAADEAKLQELELQIKTNLIPLKGKVMNHLQVAAATAGSNSAEMPMPEVTHTTSEESYLSEGATSPESSEVGLDDLDVECFSMIMEEAEERPGSQDGEVHLGDRKPSFDEDDMTDAASMVSEDSSNMLIQRAKKRPFGFVEQSTSDERGDVQEEEQQQQQYTVENLHKRRGLSVEPKKVSVPAKAQGKQVEYQCALCSETYSSSISYNPWWALDQQECPKCQNIQIPRIDITLPANTMDYHPALLAEEGDDDSDDEVGCGLTPEDLLMRVEEEEMEGPEDDDEDDGTPLTPEQAAQLLILISHVRTCPGLHKSEAHFNVCRAVKYLMLHIRDCDGKTLDGEACQFSWCRPAKQLVTHLTRCYEPEKCPVCNPSNLPKAFEELKMLNWLREQLVNTSSCTNSNDNDAAEGHAHAVGGSCCSSSSSSLSSRTVTMEDEEEDCKPTLEEMMMLTGVDLGEHGEDGCGTAADAFASYL